MVLCFSSSSPMAPWSSSSKTGSVSMVSNLVLKSLSWWVEELLRRRALFILYGMSSTSSPSRPLSLASVLVNWVVKVVNMTWGDDELGANKRKVYKNLTYQLPFPLPSFLVLVGSVSAWPDLAK